MRLRLTPAQRSALRGALKRRLGLSLALQAVAASSTGSPTTVTQAANLTR